MADRGGFGRGFGGRDGERGRGMRRGRGPRRARGPADDLKEWMPVSKLGRLVKDGKISTLETIYLHSLSIKEYQIVDFFYEGKDVNDEKSGALRDEVMKIMPVQKQTRAGQRTRFKAFVAIGDGDGHVGLGVKCAKEVATAIRGGIIAAKLSLIPVRTDDKVNKDLEKLYVHVVRRGYWGNKIGDPHTVPMKVSGKCGSVRVRLVPAPRGSQVVGAPTTKKIMAFAGLKDVFSSTQGCSKTKGNFMKALFDALSKTYSYQTPDLWKQMDIPMAPFQQHSDFLAITSKDKKEAVAAA